MKFRHNKIKREHSIIQGVLDWLEDLSKNRQVEDIIPGVIDVTHSKERGVFYQYETTTGCKLLMKSGGSIQEAFVVTKNPQAVQTWAAKVMDEINLLQSALDGNSQVISEQDEQQLNNSRSRTLKKLKNNAQETFNPPFIRDNLLAGIKEEYELVEINQGLRDSLVESFASMADFENPKLEDALEPSVRQALRKHYNQD